MVNLGVAQVNFMDGTIGFEVGILARDEDGVDISSIYSTAKSHEDAMAFAWGVLALSKKHIVKGEFEIVVDHLDDIDEEYEPFDVIDGGK